MNNIPNFSFNRDAALKGAQPQTSPYIKKSGKYILNIKECELITSAKGSSGVRLILEDNQENKLDFTLWTHSADGKEIFGYDRFMAISTCIKNKDFTINQARRKRYDWHTGQMAFTDVKIFPAFEGKKIGLLVQHTVEDYENSAGEVKQKEYGDYFACFDAETECMADEILNGATSAQALPKALERLNELGTKYKPLKKNDLQKQADYNAAYNGYANVNQQADNEPDDDLPF